MKTYEIFYQFDSQYITVKANNKREAMRELKERLKKETAYKYLIKHDRFIEEIQPGERE
jgi:hypothetical protein